MTTISIYLERIEIHLNGNITLAIEIKTMVKLMTGILLICQEHKLFLERIMFEDLINPEVHSKSITTSRKSKCSISQIIIHKTVKVEDKNQETIIINGDRMLTHNFNNHYSIVINKIIECSIREEANNTINGKRGNKTKGKEVVEVKAVVSVVIILIDMKEIMEEIKVLEETMKEA